MTNIIIFTCIFSPFLMYNVVQGSFYLPRKAEESSLTLEENREAGSFLECLALCNTYDSCTMATFDAATATCHSIGGNLTESQGTTAARTVFKKCEKMSNRECSKLGLSRHGQGQIDQNQEEAITEREVTFDTDTVPGCT